MSEFKQYQRSQIAELRPYVPGEDVYSSPFHTDEAGIVHFCTISISDEDKKNGSPKEGDMIARNPKNHADQWLVAAQYFNDNFEPLRSGNAVESSAEALGRTPMPKEE